MTPEQRHERLRQAFVRRSSVKWKWQGTIRQSVRAAIVSDCESHKSGIRKYAGEFEPKRYKSADLRPPLVHNLCIRLRILQLLNELLGFLNVAETQQT
jgi:hypothetical protein